MLIKLLGAAAAAGPRRPDRPPRAEVEPVAIELVRRHGAEIMATARRYSTTREDAEDAYQRGLEILLTKAPSTRAEDHAERLERLQIGAEALRRLKPQEIRCMLLLAEGVHTQPG
jgi:hypothetical protein